MDMYDALSTFSNGITIEEEKKKKLRKEGLPLLRGFTRYMRQVMTFFTT